MTHALAVLSVLFVTLGVLAPAAAQALDPASTEALGAVLRMLGDPAQRSATIAASPQAAAADSRIRALAGSDKLMEEFYGLAGQIFEDLTKAFGGDVSKMSEALTRAQSDPAAFAAMLSPATLAKLQSLATKMSDEKR